MSTKKIGVVGATGNQGGTVTKHLLENGFQVRAMTRNANSDSAKALAAKGVEVVEADLEHPQSLEGFLKGLDGAFLVLRFFQEDWEREVQQGKNFVDAAKKTGLPHLVFSSVASAHMKTGVPHLDSKWEVEKYIREQQVPHTILGPVAFNYSMLGYKEAVSRGIVPSAFKEDTIIFQVDEDDYAKHVVMALQEPEQWLGYRHDVASDSFPASTLATIFSEATGREVNYQKISWEDQTKVAGEEVVRLMKWIESVGPDIHVEARRRQYPWLTSFKSYVEKNW